MSAPVVVPVPAASALPDVVAREGARRRTFAIISHPDAGKTTLTEKLLLYGGAIHLAGSVKARRAARHATSDWMKLEQERGISVTSSVLQFDYQGFKVNLLDTPGHADFSEDTYRTLIAADSAVMLLDNRRGVEERTRQLFEVCHRRKTPIFTFVNKCDRPGMDPLQLLDDVERDLGIRLHPVTWPIFDMDRFVGVYDRLTRHVLLFERGEHHGATEVATIEGGLDSPDILSHASESALARLRDDLDLLDAALGDLDHAAFMAGEVSPTFFGSALTNFGVEPFLREFVQLAPGPAPRETTNGPIAPVEPRFSGFVFKIQANMDPKHRDRMAFVRVVSGRYAAGMEATLARTGKTVRLAAPQSVMARERTAIDEAFPGDVVGLVDKGTLRIGDTLIEEPGKAVPRFADIPRFAPEHFARVLASDPMRRKQLDTGLTQLSEEGAAQVFFTEPDARIGSGPAPIVGAVGQLQFDVMLFRLESEYGAPAKLESIGYGNPRWIVGKPSDVAKIGQAHGRLLVYDHKGNPIVLFADRWALRMAMERETTVEWLEEAP